MENNQRKEPAPGQSFRMDEDRRSRVLWITGLSGAGKTTLARALMPFLPEPAVLLDGDELREVFSSFQPGYDADARRRLAFVYSRLALMLARQGMNVVVATIAMFHEVREWNRRELPGYFEVFLDIPESVRKARDAKGLYALAAKGNLRNMAGGDMSVELPLHPDMRVADASLSVEQLTGLILKSLSSPDA